jgi:hypothetical protein
MHRNRSRVDRRFRIGLTGFLAALALVSSALVAGVVLAAATDNGERKSQLGSVAYGPDLAELIDAFARVERSHDELPGDFAAALAATGDAQPGEDPARSRRLDLPGDKDAFLWPASGGVCYASAGPAGCIPTAILDANGVVLSTSSSSHSPTVKVFGLAKSGVETVELRLGNGNPPIVAEVSDNAVYVELQSDPLIAVWTNPDGTPGSQGGLVPRPG